MRETMLPGAVLTRVASSHIRVGTFQFFAARGDTDGVRQLADHAIARHYPDAANAERPYHALLEGVVARQADLVARWLLVGFIHGVMNTDNSSISGETIDYGPCAFMDDYDPAQVFSSIDETGPLRLCQPAADRALESDAARRMPAAAVLRRQGQGDRTGAIRSSANSPKNSRPPIRPACAPRSACSRNATATRRWCRTCSTPWRKTRPTSPSPSGIWPTPRAARMATRMSRAQFTDPAAFTEWAVRWRQRIADEPQSPAERHAAMRAVNPAFIPRNHRVEAVIQAAVNNDDYAPFEELLTVLAKPFEDQPEFAAYADPPQPEQRVMQTFCGT